MLPLFAYAARERTLTEALAAAGFTHRPTGDNRLGHEVLDAEGRVVTHGTAADVWAWLHARGEG